MRPHPKNLSTPLPMARRGGFPANKISNLAKSEPYHCLICFDVCRSPVTCKSGAHLFCLDCLAESIKRNRSCPVCREPLDAPIPSAFATAQISALDVVCVHDKCTWKGTCGRLDNHLNIDCPQEPVKCSGKACTAVVPREEMATHEQFECLQSCPNSLLLYAESKAGQEDTCDVRLSRHDLVDHLANHCKLRSTCCPNPNCDVTTVHCQMPAHISICPHTLVSCPRQCGAQTLARQSLDAHRKDCPKEPVPCVHAPLGCSHVAPRGEIVRHEQDVEVHYSVIRSKAFAEQQQFYQQQVSEMKHLLEQKLQSFECKFDEQAKLLRRQEEQMASLEKFTAAKFGELLSRWNKEQTVLLDRLEQQTAEMNRDHQEQLQEKLEEITLSLRPLVEKAKAEADAAEKKRAAIKLRTAHAHRTSSYYPEPVDHPYNYDDD